MENKFIKIENSEGIVGDSRKEPQPQLQPEPEPETETEIFDLHDGQFWENLKKLEIEDYPAFLKKIELIQKQLEAEHNKMGEYYSSQPNSGDDGEDFETEKLVKIDKDKLEQANHDVPKGKLNIEELYKRGDDIEELYSRNYREIYDAQKKKKEENKNKNKGPTWDDLR